MISNRYKSVRTFKYMYVAERKEWMGAVIENDTVLTLACEATEAAIKQWWKTYCRTGGRVETDMYDRGREHIN